MKDQRTIEFSIEIPQLVWNLKDCFRPNEIYPNGMSTVAIDIQQTYKLANDQKWLAYTSGSAIEQDYFTLGDLKGSVETKSIKRLSFAVKLMEAQLDSADAAGSRGLIAGLNPQRQNKLEEDPGTGGGGKKGGSRGIRVYWGDDGC